MSSFDDSTVFQKLWGYGSISSKVILIFPINFLDFWFYTIEKQDFINLCSYSNKSNASLIFSEVTFLGEERMQAFVYFCVLFIHSLAWSKKYIVKKKKIPVQPTKT